MDCNGDRPTGIVGGRERKTKGLKMPAGLFGGRKTMFDAGKEGRLG